MMEWFCEISTSRQRCAARYGDVSNRHIKGHWDGQKCAHQCDQNDSANRDLSHQGLCRQQFDHQGTEDCRKQHQRECQPKNIPKTFEVRPRGIQKGLAPCLGNWALNKTRRSWGRRLPRRDHWCEYHNQKEHSRELQQGYGNGKRANVIASTTLLSAGDANIVASTDSVPIPEANSPRAIGATQLVQTANGTPAAAPNKVLSHRDLVRRRRSVARNVSAAGPKRKEKVIPTRLASNQLIVVRQTRTRTGMLRSTE